MIKIFIEKGTTGNIIITFVFTKLETESKNFSCHQGLYNNNACSERFDI